MIDYGIWMYIIVSFIIFYLVITWLINVLVNATIITLRPNQIKVLHALSASYLLVDWLKCKMPDNVPDNISDDDFFIYVSNIFGDKFGWKYIALALNAIIGAPALYFSYFKFSRTDLMI